MITAPHTTAQADHRHRDWLAERNRLMWEANNNPDAVTDEVRDALIDEIGTLEGLIMDTPATTAEAAHAQTLLVVQTCLDGFEPCSDWIERAISASAAITGMGVDTDTVREVAA